MKPSDVLSKERITNGLKNISKLRVKTSQSSLLSFSALMLILFVAFAVRILPMRWDVQTGVLHLTEFDPYYQYSLTYHMVNYGLLSPYWPTLWVDHQRWYPDGINMGYSLSSLPLTAAIAYDVISALGVNVNLMSFCSMVAAIFGLVTVLVAYFLGKDVGGKAVGMLSALFLALDASYISRSNLGWFDTETVGVFSLVLFSFLFLRAIEEDRPINSAVMYSLGSAGALAYFVTGWGAAHFLIGLTVLFVFVLFLLRRYTRRLLLAYSLTFGLGFLIATINPDVGVTYLTSFDVITVVGMFVLLLLSDILRNVVTARGKIVFTALFLASLTGGFAALWTRGTLHSLASKFFEVLYPFGRASDPLVESVAEHRISAWGSMYFDVGIVILFFAVGLFFLSRNLNNKNIFMLLFSLTTVYFASSMVRLMAILAPAFAVVASVGIVGVLRPFVALLREPPRIMTKKKFGLEHVGREFSGTAIFLVFLILMTNFAFSPQTGGVPRVFSQAYAPSTIAAGSLPIAPSQPVAEWFDALAYLNNLPDSSTTVVCSWWDYGYWLSLLGNVTSLADNATINSTQIENVGFVFMANETQSLKMLDAYHAKYVLVFITVGLRQSSSGSSYGTYVGYGDEGKWSWMARISGEAHQRFIDQGYLPDEQSSWTDESKFGSYNSTLNTFVWNDVGTNTTIYKLMSWAKQRWCDTNSVTPDESGVQPTYFKEAYFAGETLSPNDAGKYGYIIPIVAIYEIDWAKYHSSQGQ
jgi:dolichyl-diphosphooligosaccharide--protein glycosyltransferase